MPATAQIRIAADTVQFKNAMRDVEVQMNKLSTLTKKTSGTIGGLFKAMGKTSALGLFVGMPSTIIASQRSFQKFEKNMMEAFTLLPNANRQMFEKMKKDALSFSEDFGIMPEEIAKGMYQSISAGMDPMTLTEDFMKIAQKSAIAGVTDLKTSVDALTNVVNSYGAGTYDVSYVADQMFHAVSMSKMTYRELADYMYQIIPTAAAMKLRLDDLMGSISALAATGTLTRVGTTQLRQFLIELSREGDKANQAFLQGTGGIPIQKFIRDGGRLTEVIRIMGDVARQKRTDLRNLFGSVEAGNAALTLYNSDAYKGMIEALENNAEGAMSKAFEKMYNTMDARINRLLRTFMNTFTKLGQVLKPAFDDILKYFEDVAKEIKEYNWDELAQNFNIAWYRIKTAINDGKLWDLFTASANLAFKKINYFIQEVLTPALIELSDKFALLFSKEYDFGGSILSLLEGVGSYMLSLAKDFGVAIMDAFKGPVAFLASSLQTAALNMFDTFVSSLPDMVKEAVGLKTKEDRQKEANREQLAKSIMSGTANVDSINDVFYGKGIKDFDNKIEEITKQIANLPLGDGYGQKLKTLMLRRARMESERSKYAGMPEMYDKETYAGGAVSKYIEEQSDGLFTRGKYVKPVMQRALDKSLLADPYGIDKLFGFTDLEKIYQSQNMLPAEVDLSKKYAQYMNPAGLILEQRMPPNVLDQYRKDKAIPRRGYSLFGGLDKEKFMSGEMSSDYETVLERLQNTIARLEARKETETEFPAGALSDLNIMKHFYDFALERRNKIFDMVFQKKVIDGVVIEEDDLMDRYKEYSTEFQKAINDLREIQNEGGDAEKQQAVEKMNQSLIELQKKYDDLKKDSSKLEATSPEQVRRREQMLAPLSKDIEVLESNIKKMYEDLGKPPPLTTQKGADKGKDLFERDGEDKPPFDVMGKQGTVKADSKQKVGGGGGFFGYQFKAIDKNTDQMEKLTEEIQKIGKNGLLITDAKQDMLDNLMPLTEDGPYNYNQRQRWEQGEMGFGDPRIIESLIQSTEALNKAANRMENLVPSVENIEPINFA